MSPPSAYWGINFKAQPSHFDLKSVSFKADIHGTIFPLGLPPTIHSLRWKNRSILRYRYSQMIDSHSHRKQSVCKKIR